MTKHTPGPWQAKGQNIYPEGPTELSRLLATVFLPTLGGNVDERNANARLIAAAPDMLAALKFAKPFMALVDLDSSQDVVGPILDAIAKAEGS